MKRKIYIIIAVTGIFVAVCAVNYCNHEILIRFIGVIAFAVFSYMGGLWESSMYKYRKKDEGEKRQVK